MIAAVKAIETAEVPTLRTLASEHLRETDGQVKDAISALSGRLIEDKKLLKTVVEQAIIEASSSYIRKRMHDDRRILLANVSRNTREGVVVFSQGLRNSSLDFPLSNGVKLRDAMPQQVTEQADRYEAMTRDMSHKVRWLRLVVQGVPRNKKVGDVISDERANELWNETQNAE